MHFRNNEAHQEGPQEWADQHIMVNWVHECAHDLKCELLNSARFKNDAALCGREHRAALEYA